MIYFYVLSATVAFVRTASASEGCLGCRVESFTLDSMKVDTTCKKYNWSCSSVPASGEPYPHRLQEVLVTLTPLGEGFSIAWSTELETRMQAGAASEQAYFRLERTFDNRNECFAFGTNISKSRLRQAAVKLRYNLSCSENLDDTEYAMALYSEPNLFRTSKMYNFYGKVMITRKHPARTKSHSGALQILKRSNFHKTRWNPSLLFQEVQRACIDSVDLLVNFSLPVNATDETYEAILCPNYLGQCKKLEENDTMGHVKENSVNFSNVSQGKYALWLSRRGLNTATPSLTYVVKGIEWNPDIQASTSNCSTSGSACEVTISFDQPTPEFGYSNYTVCLRNRSNDNLICNELNSNDYSETILSTVFKGVPAGGYSLLVSPHGKCSFWEKTISRTFDVSNPIPVSQTTQSLTRPPKAYQAMESLDDGKNDQVITAVIGVVSAVALMTMAIGLAYLIRKNRRTVVKITNADDSNKNECLSSAFSYVSTDPTDASSCAGPLFGCSTPEVFLLFACDHEAHVTAVKALAEVLSTYGGCHVVCDQFYRPDVVNRHNWLKEQLASASAIIVVDSPAASLVHDAFLSNIMYRKYERDYPTHYHLSATLALAEELPHVKHKLARIVTGYSSKSSALVKHLEIVEFCIPDDLQALIAFIHGHSLETSGWPCREICLRSEQYIKMIRQFSAATEFMLRHPNHFESKYGPAETRLDSGFHPSTYQQWLGGRATASIGETCAQTIQWCDNLYQEDQRNAEAADFQQPPPGLSTNILRAEEMWQLFAASNSSANDNLVSCEGFNRMLRRYSSVPYSSASGNFAYPSTDLEFPMDENCIIGHCAPPSETCEDAPTVPADSASCKTIDEGQS